MATLQSQLQIQTILATSSSAGSDAASGSNLQEALGGRAAGLVVFSVAQAPGLLPVPPAQGRALPKALHGRGEGLVDGQRRLGSQARVSHPQLDLAVSLSGPERCRHSQRAWPLSFLCRGAKRSEGTLSYSKRAWNDN